jgi:hypothetical protein
MAKVSPSVYKALGSGIYCKYIYVLDVQALITGGFIACLRPIRISVNMSTMKEAKYET